MQVTLSSLTRVFTTRQFKPPTAEEGWQKRIGVDLKVNWKLAWRVTGIYATPRDTSHSCEAAEEEPVHSDARPRV